MAKQIELKIVKGPVSLKLLENIISASGDSSSIGAQSIFIGRVRADKISGRTVKKIHYEHYRLMTEKVLYEIGESALQKYPIESLCIVHSENDVPVGGISLFVLVSAKHRSASINACNFVVEEIKIKAPIWGKEIFEDETYTWKENTKA